MGPILDTLSKQQLRPKMSEVRQIKEIFLKLNIYPLYESGLISLRVGHFVKFWIQSFKLFLNYTLFYKQRQF